VTGKALPVFFSKRRRHWPRDFRRACRNLDRAAFVASQGDRPFGSTQGSALPPWNSGSALPPLVDVGSEPFDKWWDEFKTGVDKGGVLDLGPLVLLVHRDLVGKGLRRRKLSYEHLLMPKSKAKMDDLLPWIVFDPELVQELAPMLNPITRSVMIARCILTQLARKGNGEEWDKEYTVPDDQAERTKHYLADISDFFGSWNGQVKVYCRSRQADAAEADHEVNVATEQLVILLQTTQLPPQLPKDIASICQNISRLVDEGAVLYYENTMIIEHLFGMVRMGAGGQQMTVQGALSALGRVKSRGVAELYDVRWVAVTAEAAREQRHGITPPLHAKPSSSTSWAARKRSTRRRRSGVGWSPARRGAASPSGG